MILVVLFYLLCWVHLLYRVKNGGKHPDIGPREYLCDETCQTADLVSCFTVVLGTIIFLIIIF